MPQRNQLIKSAIEKSKKYGIKQWMIAERYGVSEQHFSRMLRYEMPTEKEQKVLQIIQELQMEEQYQLKEAR